MSDGGSRSVGRHLRQKLLTGLLVLLPLIITVWLPTFLFGLVDATITPWVRRVLLLTGIPVFSRPASFRYLAPLIGLAVTGLLIYGIGILSTNVFGVRLLAALDRLMSSILVVRAIYGGSKQLMEALEPRGKRSFAEVVLVEYPRMGLFTVGFVTRDRLQISSPEPLSR